MWIFLISKLKSLWILEYIFPQKNDFWDMQAFSGSTTLVFVSTAQTQWVGRNKDDRHSISHTLQDFAWLLRGGWANKVGYSFFGRAWEKKNRTLLKSQAGGIAEVLDSMLSGLNSGRKKYMFVSTPALSLALIRVCPNAHDRFMYLLHATCE